MGIELGAATVALSDGEAEWFAAVEILGDGVLKTTQSSGFAHAEYGEGVAETQVRYHSPASWQWAQPESINNGTVWVSDTTQVDAGRTWKQLATCVSREAAYDAIADYLTERYPGNYKDRNVARARDDFDLTSQRPRVEALQNSHGEVRLVAFRWDKMPGGLRHT
ncbi:hypothetical protein [Mycolicibacter arupensis]|uniref:Uncharacterized protein n=1 Tax=Mycolicibacter arupensis TaxID=342002 RepID=A0A5C7XZT2_9MYCO|nr:hypothetical protein [Mycolicibacter arupensis]TXI55069.1 MAG: hypothetical protein E6Q54_13175 [Mycolicibacter arupensis]